MQKKLSEFLNQLNKLKADKPNLVIINIARRDPEMEVLQMHNFLGQQNSVPMVGHHRQAELSMLLSSEFQTSVGKKFRLITFRELINSQTKNELRRLIL